MACIGLTSCRTAVLRILLLIAAAGYCQSRKSSSDEAQPFSYASYYQSNMVLQRAPKQAVIWGYASIDDVGKKVYVNVSNAFVALNFKAIVQPGFSDRQAVWKVLLDPVSDSHPFTIVSVLSNYVALNLTNVLFGDVWICSGQSNMKFTMSQIFNASEEIAVASKFNNIRFFSVGQVEANLPQHDLQSIEIHWSMPNEKTVVPFSSVCWLFAKNIYMSRGVPMGLIESAWGGTCIESWSSPDSLHACGMSSTDSHHNNKKHWSFNEAGYDASQNNVLNSVHFDQLNQAHSSLWNAMIHPLLNMTIYGAIWYQGEANTDYNRDFYNCTFPSMLTDWRRKWFIATEGQTDLFFPFGFVQLGPTDGKPVVAGYADIRWHQTADIGFTPNDVMRNVFMAVAFDLTDRDVHYRDKSTVSRRLALAGLAIAYEQSGFRYQGPWITSVKLNPAKRTLVVLYDYGQGQLIVRNSTGFEVCCKTDMCDVDGTDWLQAPIKIQLGANTTDTVELDVTACSDMNLIRGLRYGWRETPFQYLHAAVYSSENELPAPPFILSFKKTAKQ